MRPLSFLSGDFLLLFCRQPMKKFNSKCCKTREQTEKHERGRDNTTTVAPFFQWRHGLRGLANWHSRRSSREQAPTNEACVAGRERANERKGTRKVPRQRTHTRQAHLGQEERRKERKKRSVCCGRVFSSRREGKKKKKAAPQRPSSLTTRRGQRSSFYLSSLPPFCFSHSLVFRAESSLACLHIVTVSARDRASYKALLRRLRRSSAPRSSQSIK